MAYLWLTRLAPYSPARGGDVDYTRKVIESLAAHAPVHGIVFRRPEITPPPVANVSWTQVEGRERPRWKSLFSPLPAIAYRHVGAAYLREVVAQARGADAIFVDFIAMFWLVEPLIQALGPDRPPVIIVNHNHEASVRRQMRDAERAPVLKAALALDAFKAARLERRVNAIADAYVANTEADRRLFEADSTKPAVVITPAYEGSRAPPRRVGPGTSRRVTIFGNHEAHHKRMVLEHTLKALSARGVERTCPIEIAGGGSTKDFEARYPGFVYRGYVEDADAYFADVRLGLLPDEIGGGFKHRALHHAFHRTPMLAVDKALAGMGFTRDVHYIGADNLDELAALIPQVIDDFDRLNAVQEAAYALCERTSNWEDRGTDLHAFVRSLPGRAR